MRPQLLILASLLLTCTAASCGARDPTEQDGKGESGVDQATLVKFSLTSDAFEDGQPIPKEFTCDGADRSPALTWGEPPRGSKSFALIVDDPDAPSGLFRHWGAYDIPGATRSIGSGQSIGNQAINGFDKAGYGGPCPPPGHGTHHYHFKLYALDVAQLGLPGSPTVEQVEEEARKHAIARGELVGTYERS
jgi:Raf kinase inhibitor-like YbhB/YbcL family protein